VGLQTLFRNPLAEPYILGVSAGASFGIAFALVVGLGQQPFAVYFIPLMAFVGATLTIMLVYTLSRILRLKPISVLLLGFAVSFILAGLVTLLQFMAQKDVYHIFFSLLGSFSTFNWGQVQVLLIFVPLGIILLMFKVKDLNVVLMGDDYAQQSGVNIKGLTEYLVIVTSLLTAVAVSTAGIIGLIGVVIPLIVRLMVGLDHKILLPGSILLGALVLSVSDTLARTIVMPSELPVGVITALIGAPLFIYFLVKYGGMF
jgi:iron complex transport system permease protein